MNEDRSVHIRKEMETIRCALRDDAASIVENAKLIVDWRHFVERHPWACMATAAALGYLIVPRSRQGRTLDNATVEKIASRVQVSAPPEQAKTKGFLMGIALPLLGRAALQGGLALLQKQMRHRDHEADEATESETAVRPHRPR